MFVPLKKLAELRADIGSLLLGHGIENEMERGRNFEPLILAAESPESQHYLIEGHSRVTAYVRSGNAEEYESIVGYSPHMSNWGWIERREGRAAIRTP